MFPMLIRRFVIMAVAVPLAAASARKISDVVEARRGPSRATGWLRQGADVLQNQFGRQKRRRRFPFGR
jgi:NADH:ubiquinone oxidoreductase subunit H